MVKFTFMTLPESNDVFVNQDVVLTLEHPDYPGCEDTQKVEIFFRRDSLEHPGNGRGITPSWFYYWKEGNVVEDLAQFEFTLDDVGGKYISGGKVYVGKKACLKNPGPYTVENSVTYQEEIIGGSGEGIDFCAEVCVHELEHKLIDVLYSALIFIDELDGENDGDPYDDPDNDGLPNELEGKPPYYFNPLDADTYDLEHKLKYSKYKDYGDNEFLARKAEDYPGPVHPGKDWSDTNGKNWNK